MTVMKKTEQKEDAVSPVVGVMLMLVVTIIIAAVVAAFAGGVMTSTEKAPTAVLDVTIKNTDVSMGQSNIFATDVFIKHLSGDEIPAKDISITFTWNDAVSGKTKTHTYYPTTDTFIDFKDIDGISDGYGYGNATMYLNGNPSYPIEEAILKNGVVLQTGGNYIYDYSSTPANTVMTGNPFVDVLFTGEISATYSNVWSGGVVSTLGDSVHVTISHIPSNTVIYDSEVKVQ